MRAYSRYRNSGVGWLGEVPEHWETKRLKLVASTNDETLSESEDPLRPIAYVDIGSIDSTIGITEMEEMVFEDAPSRARRLVRDGDTIVSTVRTYLRAIAPVSAPPPEMVVSTGFAVIRPRVLAPGFASWALREQGIVEEIVARSTGVSYPAINASEIGDLPITLPPLDEQRAIAAYLDRETERIDALVAKKRVLIERLEEYRTALIRRTVTRGLPREAARAAGLDPSPRFKPSGVEWLGDVPEHWEVQRLRDCSLIQTGPFGSQLHADEYISGGTPIINPANVVEGRLAPDDEVTIPSTRAGDLARHAFKAGDIAFGRRGEMARVAVVQPCDLPALCGTGCLRIDPHRQRVEPSFLLRALGLGALRDWLELVAVGSTLANLNERIVGRIPIALPPFREQRAIATYLDQEASMLAELVNRAEAAIERLQEYRTALITAAVTGKIDVRESKTHPKRAAGIRSP